MNKVIRTSISTFASAAFVFAALSGAPAQADDLSTSASAVVPIPPPSYAVASASGDWVSTPAGLAYKSCVHQVPDGAAVSQGGDVSVNSVVVDTISACPYSGFVTVPEAASSDQTMAGIPDPEAANPPVPLADGWWLDSWWTSSKEVVKLSAQWKVPANPASDGAALFFFPSVETSNSPAIVQPVLQWGNTGAGGGNYWGIANWYVPNSGSAITSSLHSTAAGRTITGTMTRSSGTASYWDISFTQSTGDGASLYTDTGRTSWKEVQGGVLEVYYASSCSRLPNASSVTFSKIAVSTTSGAASPSFSNNRNVTSCSSSISSTSTTTKLGWTP